MYINKLENIIKPTNELTDNYTKEEWDEIELKLGIKLPTDYKEFINRYGVGMIFQKTLRTICFQVMADYCHVL